MSEPTIPTLSERVESLLKYIDRGRVEQYATVRDLIASWKELREENARLKQEVRLIYGQLPGPNYTTESEGK